MKIDFSISFVAVSACDLGIHDKMMSYQEW